MVKLKDSLRDHVVDCVLVPTATAMPTPAGPGDPTAQAAAAAAGFAAAVRMQAADARVIEINPFVPRRCVLLTRAAALRAGWVVHVSQVGQHSFPQLALCN